MILVSSTAVHHPLSYKISQEDTLSIVDSGVNFLLCADSMKKLTSFTDYNLYWLHAGIK